MESASPTEFNSSVERPKDWHDAEYLKNVRGTLEQYLKGRDIDVESVLFAGYSKARQDDQTNKQQTDFGDITSLSPELPDSRDGNPIVFALQYDDGVIGIYDAATIEQLNGEPMIGFTRGHKIANNVSVAAAESAKIAAMQL